MSDKWRNPNKLRSSTMKKKSMFRVLPLIFVCVMVISCSKVPKFDHYGVYIKQENDFKEIKSYNWIETNESYKNSRDFDTKPIIFENELEIYVYSAKAKLNNYNLIMPFDKNRNGDFECSNSEYSDDYSAVECTVEPIEKSDDIVIIRSKNNGGTFILQVEEENKGYIFTSQNNVFNNEIKQTISNWITSLNNSNYTEFLELYHSPKDIEEMKKENIYERNLNNIEEYKNDLLEEFEAMLDKIPISYPQYIFFENSNTIMTKENEKWYQLYDSNVIYNKAPENRQSIIGDLNNLAASALAFYKTPATHGGGAGFFGSADGDDVGTWIGYDWDGKNLKTANGIFTLAVSGDVLTIVGTGNEIGNDGATKVKATISITGAKLFGVKTTINN
jgi:hypothetical protein